MRRDGSVALISDNTRYPAEEVPSAEVPDLQIAGGVVRQLSATTPNSHVRRSADAAARVINIHTPKVRLDGFPEYRSGSLIADSRREKAAAQYQDEVSVIAGV